MKLANPQQIKTIHILLSSLGKARGEKVEKAEKEQIVREFSDGRAESTTCLSVVEAAALITELSRRVPAQEKDPCDKMRKKIIHYAHEVKWELEGGQADMDRIDNWCKKFGYLKKGLNEYTAEELPRLVSQMEAVYISFIKGV